MHRSVAQLLIASSNLPLSYKALYCLFDLGGQAIRCDPLHYACRHC
jgi:hypothetical protein